jgi:hypothetical protein
MKETRALPRELECRRWCAQASFKQTQLKFVWFSLVLALWEESMVGIAACLPIVLVPSGGFPVHGYTDCGRAQSRHPHLVRNPHVLWYAGAWSAETRWYIAEL